MKTYKVSIDTGAYLALSSNASIVDQESGDDVGTNNFFIEVTGNYGHFEQQLDTTEGVYRHEVVETDEE